VDQNVVGCNGVNSRLHGWPKGWQPELESQALSQLFLRAERCVFTDAAADLTSVLGRLRSHAVLGTGIAREKSLAFTNSLSNTATHAQLQLFLARS